MGEHQTCVRISIRGRKLYSGGVDGNVCVWDRESGKARKIYKACILQLHIPFEQYITESGISLKLLFLEETHIGCLKLRKHRR